MKQITSPTPKSTRQEVAAHTRLSLRTIDTLTASGVLPYFKIGKSVRYDLSEVDEALRERFHVERQTKQGHTPKP